MGQAPSAEGANSPLGAGGGVGNDNSYYQQQYRAQQGFASAQSQHPQPAHSAYGSYAGQPQPQPQQPQPQPPQQQPQHGGHQQQQQPQQQYGYAQQQQPQQSQHQQQLAQHQHQQQQQQAQQQQYSSPQPATASVPMPAPTASAAPTAQEQLAALAARPAYPIAHSGDSSGGHTPRASLSPGSATGTSSAGESPFNGVSMSSPPTSLTERVRAIIGPAQYGAETSQHQHQQGSSGSYESSSSAAAAAAAAADGGEAAQDAAPVPTVFRWRAPCREAFVTGSFNGWQGKVALVPDAQDPDTRVIVLALPAGAYYYKYIVDDAWRVDDEAPVLSVQGVVTNVVVVRPPFFAPDAGTNANAGAGDSDDEDGDRGQSSYGHYIPPHEDLAKEVPKLPGLLSHRLLLNAQRRDPYELPVPLHVSLNHLYTCEVREGVTVTAITQRFRPTPQAALEPKYVTTLYYAPVRYHPPQDPPPTG